MQTANPISLSLIIFLAACGALFSATTADGGTATRPTQALAVEFDLEAGRLNATSKIQIPAGIAIDIDLTGLEIDQLVVNGAPVSQPAPTTLPLTAQKQDQEIQVFYHLIVANDGSDPADNLVSPAGITLTERWHPAADRDLDFKLVAALPNGFSGISEADEIIAFPRDGRQQVIFRYPYPLRSITLAAGPYRVVEKQFSGNRTLAAYFFEEDAGLADAYLDKAAGYLARYEELLGPYPYSRFSIVENRQPSGFAMPTFTLLGQAVVRLPFIMDTSLGHEILHQWFGNGIQRLADGSNWVEGLTTYLADQAFAADDGIDAQYRKEQITSYLSYVQDETAVPVSGFIGAAGRTDQNRSIRAIGYNKSSMIFHMLRKKIGDAAFYAGLRDFFNTNIHRRAGWRDIEAAFSSHAGQDLTPFFSQWLDRSDIPSLALTGVEVKETDGMPGLFFNLNQENDPAYQLDVPLVIKTTEGDINKIIQINGRGNRIEIPLTASPLSMVLDPEYDIMRRLGPKELPPTWSRFAGAAKRLCISPAGDETDIFRPLAVLLADSGCTVMIETEVASTALAENSILFLGESNLSRTLLARAEHPAEGITVDIRANPLAPGQVLVLVTAAARDEVAAAAPKLSHYGKYSFLHFVQGSIRDKQITETDIGMVIRLDSFPDGIETNGTTSFDAIIEKLLAYRVIYIGESHTSYEDHLLQLKIIRALHRHDPRLAIGMEMFSRSTQAALDDYLARKTDLRTFLKQSHYFDQWRFDYRLYRDIIEFARRHQLPVVALNQEKEIVSNVYRQNGPDNLADDEKTSLPEDRDLAIDGYRERLFAVYNMHAGQGQAGEFPGFIQSQALWDETMAETAAIFLETHPDDRLVILAGRGHVNKDTAIPPRVERRLPVSQAVVINSNGADIDAGKADYLFFSPPASLPPQPLLGVRLEDAPEGSGALIAGLMPTGAAKQAGIREKDVITTIDGQAVTSLEDVKIIMLDQEGQTSVTVEVLRPRMLFGPKKLEFNVELQSDSPGH